MSDEDVALVLDDAQQGMEKSLDSLQRDLARIRTGRANPALLDGIQVDYSSRGPGDRRVHGGRDLRGRR